MLPMCPFAVPSLADPSRRKLYEILMQAEDLTVTQLAKKLKLRQPTASYHLKRLEKDGLVQAKKKGREVYYQAVKTCPEGKVCF